MVCKYDRCDTVYLRSSRSQNRMNLVVPNLQSEHHACCFWLILSSWYGGLDSYEEVLGVLVGCTYIYIYIYTERELCIKLYKYDQIWLYSSTHTHLYIYTYNIIYILSVCVHQLCTRMRPHFLYPCLACGRGAILPTATVNPQEPWGLTGGPLGDPEHIVLGHVIGDWLLKNKIIRRPRPLPRQGRRLGPPEVWNLALSVKPCKPSKHLFGSPNPADQ